MFTLHVTTDHSKALDRALESAILSGYPTAVLWHDDSVTGRDNIYFGVVLSLSETDIVAFDLGTLRQAQRHFVAHNHDRSASCLRHGIVRDIIKDAERLENALGDAAYDLLSPNAIRDFFLNLLGIAIGQAFNTSENNPTST